MGSDKIVSYPLALLGSFALFSQPGMPVGSAGGAEGAGGTVRAPVASMPAAMAPIPASTVVPPAVPPPPGRPSAESAELRALRMDEGAIFPEYGPPRRDHLGSVPPDASCDSPDYDLAQSIEAEIPAAGDWLRGLKRPDLAVPRDPKVARYIRYFASSPRGRETFAAWLRRSGAYRDVVTTALNRLNLPVDLMAVMFVESGCWAGATSSAGAAGLWQFMPQTGRAYGLSVQRGYDERRSIWKSTEAALTHLSDLHAQFESWHLALAAYNLGYQQLSTRLHTTHTEDFFTLAKIPDALPRETALYVPKILAIAVILRNLEYFGFDGIERLSPISASRIEVPPHTRLSLVARAAGTSARKLKELNPQILGDSIPDIGSPIYVYVPSRGLARAKAMLPRLLEDEGGRGYDLKVASDFDWGRDEVDANWRSRLERTKPGGDTESSNDDRTGDARRDSSSRDSSSRESGRDSSGRDSSSRESGRDSSGRDSSSRDSGEGRRERSGNAESNRRDRDQNDHGSSRRSETLAMSRPLDRSLVSINGEPRRSSSSTYGDHSDRSERSERSERAASAMSGEPRERAAATMTEPRERKSDRADHSDRADSSAERARQRGERGASTASNATRERNASNTNNESRERAKSDRFGERGAMTTSNDSHARTKSEHGTASASNESHERKAEFAYRGEKQKAQEVPTYYRIKPGDTLSELAESFKVPSRKLATSNGIANPSHILAGSRIRVAADSARAQKK